MLNEQDEKFFSGFNYHINKDKEIFDFLVFSYMNLRAMRDTIIDLSAKVEGISEEDAIKKFQDRADEYGVEYLTKLTDRYGKLSDNGDTIGDNKSGA